MSNNIRKEELRKWAKDIRQKLDLKRISIEIQEEIKQLQKYKSAKNIMSYMAKDIEVSLNDLFQDKTKNWFLPVAEVRHGMPLDVVPYVSDKTKLTKNKYGILEPEIINDNYYDQITKKINLDLIFVPGLCFDKKGYRIGFGKGYYDKFLKLNPNGFKLGCCPKECLLEGIPVDKWDEKVDLVVAV